MVQILRLLKNKRLEPKHYPYQWRIYIVKFSARPPPPGVQILSISCSFWEILAKSYVGAPPLGSWRPLLEEIKRFEPKHYPYSIKKKQIAVLIVFKILKIYHALTRTVPKSRWANSYQRLLLQQQQQRQQQKASNNNNGSSSDDVAPVRWYLGSDTTTSPIISATDA